MPNSADIFADQTIEHSLNLMRLAEGSREVMAGWLLEMQNEILPQIAAKSKTPWAKSRLAALRNSVSKTVSTYMDGPMKESFINVLSDTHQVETAFQRQMFSKIGVTLTAPSLTVAQAKTFIEDKTVLGHPFSDWWKTQSEAVAHRFRGQITMGVMAGETTDQITKRILGTATGQKHTVMQGKRRVEVDTYLGGLMGVTEAQVRTLVHTSIHAAANATRNDLYQKNADTISGVQALSTLDARTSDICKARSGMAWKLSGEPLNEAAQGQKFPGPPPWHFNCRTTLIPITKSWSELAGSNTVASKRSIDAIAAKAHQPSTQASMDGPVASDLTYEGWLKSKPVEFQKEVLGEARWQLWDAGKLTSFTQLVDQSGRSLTAEELLKKYDVAPTAQKSIPIEALTQRAKDFQLMRAAETEFNFTATADALRDLSVDDRLLFAEMIAPRRTGNYGAGSPLSVRPEFGLPDTYLFQLRHELPKTIATAAEMRKALIESGKVVAWKPNVVYKHTSMPNKTVSVDSLLEGLTSSQKEEMLTKLPKFYAKMDSYKLHVSTYLEGLREAFTKPQLIQLIDGLDREYGGKGIPFITITEGDVKQPAEFYSSLHQARSRLAWYSKDYETWRDSMLQGWVISGKTAENEMLRNLVGVEFPPKLGGQFFQYQAIVRDSSDRRFEMDADRVLDHLKMLKAETAAFYEAKIRKGATLTVYRGVGAQTQAYAPSSVESWTSQKSTASLFANMMSNSRDLQAQVFATKVSYNDLLWSYESQASNPRWPKEKELKGKKEFVLLGQRLEHIFVNELPKDRP